MSYKRLERTAWALTDLSGFMIFLMSLEFEPAATTRSWKRDMGIGLILAVLMTMPIFML